MILLGLFSLSSIQFVSAQEKEDRRWEKVPVQYSISIADEKPKFDLKFKTAEDYVLKPALNLYRIFISDADGANCPFDPSCSHFFLDAVNKTNFLEGLLLFSDRFQRDANLFNRTEYSLSQNRRLSDPVERYISR
ncbi:MAG: membrane protein insertion efficiency factor YidD [Bacteroidetes bacterium]|nr:membrane protein insertion efficiency factor YidD [Bacteroidota bacterium]